ncbi:Crp/Fnr family transcriptional regulator [Cyanobium sp. CH-040]|uniref:Crp/Fnr family transcriptional regulator n=1 Tax=Cyanobium sp. CH-040 TaxID=2823708 RepID=UPI0020CFA19A|nr:cyclic nucleotide-binding domain-containing protein [Cyanobium sp. CH-040]MCP9927782.1 cyclic nucleotide-binding domain-containing protein [Cyanobium sp. CH-040]
MEAILNSFLTPGGLVGHLAYVFLLLSMLMRKMVALRIFFGCSLLLDIIYIVVWVRDPVLLLWEVVLFVMTVTQLVLILWYDRFARFSDEERAFAVSRLRGLSPRQTRHLLDQGQWRDLPPDTVLTHENQRPLQLTYIVSGSVGVYVNQQRIASCGSGRYIGEMSVLDQEPASATVLVEDPVRVWQLPTDRLDRLRVQNPAVAAVLEAGIGRDMRRKLVDINASSATRVAGAFQDPSSAV